MTYKEITNFLLSGWVNVENCGIRSIDKEENPEEIFGSLCDYIDHIETGVYFYFYTDNENYKWDLERCLGFTEDKTAAYEFPNIPGWYILFRISG